jgi:putative cell wall-binding protein
MGAPKRVAVGLLAGSLAMFGVALAPQAGATTTVTNERLAGTNRYGTAASIAGDEAFTTPTTAIIATGENFPDALAAASLAGANAAAPIILTQTNAYTGEAKTALAALKGKGVAAVTIVGGTSAVSDAVETAIKGDGFTTSRIAGDDRFETAAAIASAANTKSAAAPIGGLKAALIATGSNYPDALAGGPAAYANKLPLLLVNNTVPTDTANAISTLGIKKVYILGGTSAVSSAVEASLVQATGNPATRLAGTDRFSTATAIGDFEQATLAFPVTSAILATGINFPDALAAGPLGGQLKAPIVLTASLPDASKAWLDKNSKTITKLYVAGGTSSIDDATVVGATTAAQTTNNDVPANAAVTARPELVSATIGTTTTSGINTGTVIRYTFDSVVPVAAAQAARFHAVAFAGGGGNRFSGTSVAAVSGDANSIDVNFAGVTTPTAAALLTVATVEFGAVTDAVGAASPEGDAQLGATGTSSPSLAAGVTSAPDLTAVQNFRSATSTLTFVDFVFDQAPTNLNGTPVGTVSPGETSGYHLVGLSGLDASQVDCTYNSVAATTITAACQNTAGGTAGATLTAAAYARGYVDPGTVQATVAPNVVNNALEAADVSNGGNTGTPDITAASFNANGTGVDLVVVVFDQAITSADATQFRAYTSGGGTVTPLAATTSGATPNNVLLSFSNDSLASAVGVFAFDDAVLSSGGINPLTGNEPDEVGFANTTTSSTTAGATDDPDLLSVTRTAATDPFGTATGGFNVTYTFDENVAVPFAGTAGNFHLYLADGTRLNGLTCTSTADTGLTTTAKVTCSAFVLDTGGAAAANAQVSAAVLGTVQANTVAAATGGVLNQAEGAAVIA